MEPFFLYDPVYVISLSKQLSAIKQLFLLSKQLDNVVFNKMKKKTIYRFLKLLIVFVLMINYMFDYSTIALPSLFHSSLEIKVVQWTVLRSLKIFPPT